MIEGKTIFITGGNSGIGLDTALLFAENGANIAIVGRNADKNKRAVEKISSNGAACLAFAGSVSDEAFIDQALQATVAEFGGLHYAFNNAGTNQPSTPLVEQTNEDYDFIMDVNVRGTWLCMRKQVPHMLASGGGCIVNNASVTGHVAVATFPLYTASKHAVVGLTKAVALELAEQGIRVNCVSPGAVMTELWDEVMAGGQDKAIIAAHPMGRVGHSREISSGVLYLCRDATWTTGQCLCIDGGYTVP